MTDASIDPDQARERIASEQARVEALVEGLRDELGSAGHDDAPDFGDPDPEPGDAGSDTFEREKDLSILEQLEEELGELQAALARVDAGTYGIDEVTGEPIDPARLDALPAARTNVDTPLDTPLDTGTGTGE